MLDVVNTIIFILLYERECREKCHLPACMIAPYCSLPLETSWNQCGTREHGMHNVLKQMFTYWHLSLLYPVQGKGISSNLCSATSRL